ncbi:MAG: DUF1049 domain-containing protein [Paludibacteraceae bacterium]|nr:DUF1049 domain-containing protein [Paludibacteraceae bacterium]
MRKLSFKQIVDILLIVLMLVFAGQNVASVHLQFLFFGFELPLIILIGFVFFIGYLTAILFRKKDKSEKSVALENKDAKVVNEPTESDISN